MEHSHKADLRQDAMEHAAAAFDADLLQRARDIAADVCAATAYHDPEHNARYCQMMRDGRYDDTEVVKAALAGLLAGAA